MTPADALADARRRLIFALDVESQDQAQAYVRRLRPEVSFYKVGMELFFAAGPPLVAWLKGEGLRVFLDIKLLDIPATVERAVRAAGRLGADLVTVHGEADALQAACRGRQGGLPRVFAVTVLTSQAGGGVARQVEERARLAAAAGADGVIAAGRREEIEAVGRAGANLQVISPGIRPAGGTAADQRRVVTPAEAIANGADYLVVGRPIRDAGDPLAAARRIVREMAGALAGS
jgi:orotidine-5'-phosphate decarboxylase